jgi:predicted nucleic acid-binding protein
MTAVIVDTSAYSASRKGHAGLAEALRVAELVAVNAVVVGELLAGFQGGSRRRENEADLARFLSNPRVSLLPIDRETAERYAAISNSLREAGTPIPTNDVWIAASAMQHGLTLVTTDAHFLKVPQVLVRYFEVE